MSLNTRQQLDNSSEPEFISKNLTTVRVAGSARDVAVFGDLLFAFRRATRPTTTIVCDDALTVHSFLHHS